MIEIKMRKSFIYTVVLTFGYFCEISGWIWRSKDCTIPKGNLYDRATFRLQYSNDISPLGRGEQVVQYQRVVVVCDKDIQSDLIITYHVITCHRGKWRPRMPQCAGPKNCNHLDPVTNAKPEVVVGDNIDYPHGTVVRYTCKPGYTLIGHDERYCQDGVWSDIKFNCTRKQAPKNCKQLDPVTNAIQEVLLGNNIEYPHETVVRYTCEPGYTLTGQNERQCRNGVWDGVKFNCTRIYVPETCEAVRDRFEMVNDIGSVTQIENGSKVRLQCPWSWVPKDGILVAACIDGEWKPSKPECTVLCKLPRKRNNFFTYPGMKQPITTSRVANRVTVVQHCRTGRGRSSSTCTNGRWRPAFRYCPTVRRRRPQTSRIAKSIDANCTIPDNALALYISIADDTMTGFDKVPQGEQIMQVCVAEEYLRTEFDNSKSSYCYGGKWVPAFENCSNSSSSANETKCNKPDIDNAVLIPDLDKYFANETIMIQCHRGEDVIKYNATCLDTGKWSESNISCEGVEEETYCKPPQKTRLVYWPVKELYELNDTVTVLECGEGLVLSGSAMMRCSTAGSWEGDFECLPSCANGRPDIKAVSVNIPDNSQVDVVRVGFVDGIDECAKNCLSFTNFSCKSIQVFTFKESLKVYCQLLSEVADNTSEKFVQVNGIGSRVYNIYCDNTCMVPTDEEVILTDMSGQKREANETMPDGTVLNVGCVGDNLQKQKTVTCVAGQWNKPNPYCNPDMI